ncbi:RraA family protein [Oceanobacillus halophilus]|uniref:Putative 4-hydroxy-4-methyl-2-oxoglutarate aldolase n=1 Tax=Oceanobacillus halophilus TaxID=930130 RepID=A0A495AHH2_9BACI|nr:RraA family protein [Oceanobacillus halophilus]RKQ37975.1 RraA family protein [Oceanobacillus halophilus]
MDLIEEFKSLPTTCVSDVLRGLNNLDPSIKPLKEEYKIAGRAFTVKIPAGDNLGIQRAIKEASQGDILVIDGKGETYRAIAGDFVIGMAQTVGLGGFIVDGVVRDVAEIRELNYPVFCKGSTVAASLKVDPGEINIPISCGGVPVNPGDIIVGDVNGIVIVPQEKAEETLQKAKKKLAKDNARDQKVLGKPEEVYKYIDGVLSKK